MTNGTTVSGWIRTLVFIGAPLLVIGAIGFAMEESLIHLHPRTEVALEKLAQAPRDEKNQVLLNLIITAQSEWRSNASQRSMVYFGCLFGSAFLGAGSAVLLKLESMLPDAKVRTDTAAILSMLAALLITLSSTGDFKRKWEANRLAAARAEALAYEFLRDDRFDRQTLITRFQQIALERNETIVGAGRSSPDDSTLSDAAKTGPKAK